MFDLQYSVNYYLILYNKPNIFDWPYLHKYIDSCIINQIYWYLPYTAAVLRVRSQHRYLSTAVDKTCKTVRSQSTPYPVVDGKTIFILSRESIASGHYKTFIYYRIQRV